MRFPTLVFFRQEDRAVFAFGFAKSDKANLSAVELRVYKQAAKIDLELTQA
ncbi:type II toxin-antitoxin system RelE/ParE family toxin [uncultured Sphingomonas sp.]|uniref:type II toxin-antitoxin system RelE/ParE family toxin n=1 Tax=uncultured Sphingomonas sp. TaxID=158754 RepID=UPI0034426FFE